MARKDGTQLVRGRRVGGGEAVITDISFQRVSQDIKVARGDHYSDIVRASLFPSSQASAFPTSPSSPPSSSPPSVFLSRWNRSTEVRPREEEIEREREGGKRSLLIRIPGPFQRHLVANPFRSRRISTRTRPLEIGTRAGFQSREFPSTPSRLFFSLSPPLLLPPVQSSPSRSPLVRKWTRREESLNGS